MKALLIIGIILVVFSGLATIIGALFKIMHWYGSNIGFIIAAVLGISGIGLIIIYIIKNKNT